MTVIDLTHTITDDTPVYPGTKPPSIVPISTIEHDGFREAVLTMYSHTGTHIDAPHHIIHDGKTLDTFPPSQFIGSAIVIDCSHLSNGEKISVDHIKKYEKYVNSADFLLFYTNWDRFWGKEQYFIEYPCLSEEATNYVHSLKLKGVGIDTISVDPVGVPLTNHIIILGDMNAVIIENLTNLGEIGDGLFSLVALPLKSIDSDGAPARVIAIKE